MVIVGGVARLIGLCESGRPSLPVCQPEGKIKNRIKNQPQRDEPQNVQWPWTHGVHQAGGIRFAADEGKISAEIKPADTKPSDLMSIMQTALSGEEIL